MSGAWATAADARNVLPHTGLEHAAYSLGMALTMSQPFSKEAKAGLVLIASAIIRRERKKSGKSTRIDDYLSTAPDEFLLWEAISWIARCALTDAHYCLRDAEAALRTWWKRNGS